jgi:hypothetical protein
MPKGSLEFFLLFCVLLFATGFSYADEYHNQNDICAVARCNGCHTMHNSQNGEPVDQHATAGNEYLLMKSTPSDTCLNCHSRYGQCSTDGQSLSPGGDFYWTRIDVSWTNSENVLFLVEGREHGHNINAPGHGLSPDQLLSVAPGGAYQSSILGCHSCHDPHGNTNFRMLYGIGETAEDYPGGYTFSFAAPVAIGLNSETARNGAGAEKTGQHTAYISGMSEWCANCHQAMLSDASSSHLHSVGVEIGAQVSRNYNSYVTTGDMTGDWSTAYLPLVPFEDPANTTTGTSGTMSSSKVMCLTCHRAHASPYADAGRWDFRQTRLKDGGPPNEPYLLQYQDQPLNMARQRSLCNKCHAFDINS